jgi:phytanoyl-CoA dioxygenase PhyH
MNEVLNQEQIQSFITDGFVRIDNAFTAEIAREARNVLWKDIPGNPADPNTWTQPVVWLGMYTQEPFIKAANTPILYSAFDQLVGKGKWVPCMSMGAFPVRFPSSTDSGDTGWHVDAGFAGADPNDYFGARINVLSKGRALLMLFLFSDVSALDAPTIILKGSHLDVARLLKTEGDAGLSFMELAERLPELAEKAAELSESKEVSATGKAGTVYLCHPFLVHRAQRHQGTEPRFLAQPPLLLRNDFETEGKEQYCPVEEAIRMGLNS